jgi:hypothetical protein
MKTKIPFLWLAVAAVSVLSTTGAHAFGPYFNPYDGTAVVQTGKKKGTLLAVGNAATTDGSDASVQISGQGPKGINVKVTLDLASDGKGSLVVDAKVPADPSLFKGKKAPRGKKVHVKIKAKGNYEVVDENTVNFVFSGNAGKGGGTNVSGTFSVDALGNMTLQLSSGFKQKVNGLGRRIAVSFAGVSSTTPEPEPEPEPEPMP